MMTQPVLPGFMGKGGSLLSGASYARVIRFAGCLAMLQCGVVCAAPVTAPDAGQALRELQSHPMPNTPQIAPTVEVEKSADNKPGSDVRFLVKRLDITGNSEVPTATLDVLVNDLVGSEHSLTELLAGAERITSYYYQHGYPAARAYLPAQEIKDGAVKLRVMEGRIDQHRINNQSHLSDTRASAYFDQLKKGGVIKSDQINRSLRLLNETPGVGGSRATLQPGASVGTSELLIELQPGTAYSGNVDLDNYGNRFTGEYRLGATLNLNSPLRIGDQITFSAFDSGPDLMYGRLAYQLPIGSNGLRVGAAYLDTRYRLGKDFAALEAHGIATGSSVFSIYPLIRHERSQLTGTASWERKNLTDYADVTESVANKKIRLTSLALSGMHQDTLGGGGICSLDLTLAQGNLDITSAYERAVDDISALSNGAYTRLSYNFNRLQQLTPTTVLSLALSGQQASKNLDSSEKFSLGGSVGVRAYPQGEGIGDEGYLVNLELRKNITSRLQGVVFYDTGSVTISRNPYSFFGANKRKLAGVGVGVNSQLFGVQIKAALAWRTVGGRPVSIPDSAVRTPNMWIKMSKAL